MRLKAEYHRYLFIVGLLLLAAGLPLSRALMSIGQMVLIGNWLLEGQLRNKWQRFVTTPAAWLFTSIFLLHVVGLAWTTDFEYALNDLRIKLPLLIVPLVLSTSGWLKPKQYQLVEWVFIGAVLIGSLVSTGVWMGWTNHEVADIRDISIFISHIRFGLLIALAIFLLMRTVLARSRSSWMRILALVLSLWLGGFLLILESFSGLGVLLVGGYVLALVFAFKRDRKVLRWTFGGGILAATVVVTFYMVGEVREFLPLNESNPTETERFSELGEEYHHALEKHNVENGHYLYRFIAKEELKAAWSERSAIPLDSLDAQGHHLKTTLLRYLTSKNLRKDRAGLSTLDDAEIKAIESGVANVRFRGEHNIDTRVYQVIWQLYNYYYGENPEGNSVAQRIEFWKTGVYILKQHPIVGVGTGDVKSAFQQAYIETNSPLSEQYRHRSHNQYLTMAIAFGCIGLLWFLLALIVPPLLDNRFTDYRFLALLSIILASMLYEDTLETQAGATLVAFFYCLFLWTRPRYRYSDW